MAIHFVNGDFTDIESFVDTVSDIVNNRSNGMNTFYITTYEEHAGNNAEADKQSDPMKKPPLKNWN